MSINSILGIVVGIIGVLGTAITGTTYINGIKTDVQVNTADIKTLAQHQNQLDQNFLTQQSQISWTNQTLYALALQNGLRVLPPPEKQASTTINLTP